MRRLLCVLLFTLSGPLLAEETLTDGLADGSLQPFVELTAKQSSPGEGTLHLRGFRLGVSRGPKRQLALAYYRSGDTRYDANTHYELRYGGFVFGDIPDGDDLIEPTFQMLIGSGAAEVKTPWGSRTSSPLFVMEPEIGFGVNVTTWAQVGMGVSYRYLNGLQVLGLSGEDLRGATSNVHVMLHF